MGILPMFLQNKTVDLMLSSEDVSLWLRFTVLPSYVFKKLKLVKTLSCRMIEITEGGDIPDKFCHPSTDSKESTKGRRLDASQGYSIACTPTSAVLQTSDSTIVV